MNKSTAFSQLAARCSTTELCIADIRSKLERMELTDEERDAIVQRLLDEHFIDEGRYARAFVSDKFRFARWGRIKIRQALRQKGIAAADINEALQTIDDDAYRQTLIELLAAKRRTLKASSPYEANGKLIRFAAGRGFEPSLICQFLDADDIETE